MAKDKSTISTLPDPAPAEPVDAPPTRGGAYVRLPGGDLRKVEPEPATPAEPASKEN